MDHRELAQLIRREMDRLAEEAEEADAEMEPLEVRIRTDRTVPYREVEPIMRACALEGVWKVTFAVVDQ